MAVTTQAPAFDVAAVKAQFPTLARTVHDGIPVVYLDSAASSQRPQCVLDAMDRYYNETHANVHRGVYTMAEEATARYEGARATIARFIGAASEREVLFSKNVTESINLVSNAWGRANLRAGDVVVLTELEHHANIVPWLMLKEAVGIELRYLGLTPDGRLDLSNLDQLLAGAKLLGVSGVSNVLGTINPVQDLAAAAHAAGAVCLVDAAQWAPHLALDVQAMGADLVAFTGHKMCGPTGIGVLWGREALLDSMPPFLGGGDMIRDVRLDGFTPNELPWKFEAGTPPIAEAVGLGAAVEWLSALGMDAVRDHERRLNAYALRTLPDRYGNDFVIHGPADPDARGGVLSFAFKDVHPHDLSQVLDQHGVCVRAGHHCAKPLMRRLCVGATARASWYVYNDEADIDALADALAHADALFGL